MIDLKKLEEMREFLKASTPTPSVLIAYQLMDELEELAVVLQDIKGSKICFCNLGVHTLACKNATRWLKALFPTE